MGNTPAGSAPTARFSDRVGNYLKARPAYPREIISFLVSACGLTPASTVVDVGCGTGLLAERFCEFGCRVIGVEPNPPMRSAGEEYLARYANFQMVDGTAESIPLADAASDFICAGQAFHWFDIDAARREFMRVLKPRGWAVLVWNIREFEGSPFAEDYERLLVRFGTDYSEVHHRGKASAAAFERFFGHRAFREATFSNAQQLDHDSFVARVLSSSYMPSAGHPNYGKMMEQVRKIFETHARDGQVTMRYNTSVTYGQMADGR